MNKYDGGPALPVEWRNDSDVNLTAPNGRVVPPNCTEQLPGMSLRDYFAAACLTGMLSKRGGYVDDECSENSHGLRENAPDIEVTALYCYAQADAMLKERNK